MLEQVIAVRFDRRMGSGKTKPCLLACLRPNGEEIEVIAKFSAGCERKTVGLAIEAVAAMLAADLDLPVPEPVLVEYDQDFISLLPKSEQEIAQLMRTSLPIAYGSTKLPGGFSLWPASKTIPQLLQPQAVEIFAFDALIQNPDRRPENPNCLSNGRNFAIFDHELAFVTRSILGWRPPWQIGSLEEMKRQHVFFASLSGREHDLSRLRGAWQAISDDRLKEYHQALPSEWRQHDAVKDTLEYLAEVRDHLDRALSEIKRVLS